MDALIDELPVTAEDAKGDTLTLLPTMDEMLPEPWLGYYLHLQTGVERAHALRQQAQQMLAEAVHHETALQAFAGYCPQLGLDQVQITPDGHIIRPEVGAH